ncbi:MAG: hypothetical protein DSM106950_09285 [Stigonema ocellatum SAG 48.90 = DSM 106950]|nr:hypothetical protein [Stigonema ocellatum SAG 48.90 = DSM 106950]
MSTPRLPSALTLSLAVGSTLKGGKRLKNQPVLHEEVKKKHSIALTPTAWEMLQSLAHDIGLSVAECLEQLIRKSYSA